MRSLLAFCGFTDDTQCVLTRILEREVFPFHSQFWQCRSIVSDPVHYDGLAVNFHYEKRSVMTVNENVVADFWGFRHEYSLAPNPCANEMAPVP